MKVSALRQCVMDYNSKTQQEKTSTEDQARLDKLLNLIPDFSIMTASMVVVRPDEDASHYDVDVDLTPVEMLKLYQIIFSTTNRKSQIEELLFAKIRTIAIAEMAPVTQVLSAIVLAYMGLPESLKVFDVSQQIFQALLKCDAVKARQVVVLMGTLPSVQHTLKNVKLLTAQDVDRLARLNSLYQVTQGAGYHLAPDLASKQDILERFCSLSPVVFADVYYCLKGMKDFSCISQPVLESIFTTCERYNKEYPDLPERRNELNQVMKLVAGFTAPPQPKRTLASLASSQDEMGYSNVIEHATLFQTPVNLTQEQLKATLANIEKMLVDAGKKRHTQAKQKQLIRGKEFVAGLQAMANHAQAMESEGRTDKAKHARHMVYRLANELECMVRTDVSTPQQFARNVKTIVDSNKAVLGQHKSLSGKAARMFWEVALCLVVVGFYIAYQRGGFFKTTSEVKAANLAHTADKLVDDVKVSPAKVKTR